MSIVIPRLRRKPRLGACELDRQHPLSRGLVAWWFFNEGGGSKLWDIAGSNHGTLTNMDPGTDWVASPRGGALAFDGTDDYIQAGSTLPYSSITITSWIRWDTLVSNKGIFVTRGIFLELHSTLIQWYPNTDTTVVTATSGIVAGRWHHVAVTQDAGGAWALYVDGKSVGSGSTVALNNVTAHAVRIGSYVGSGNFNGSIDDVRFFSRALSQAEIQRTVVEPYANILVPQYRRYFIPAAGVGYIPYPFSRGARGGAHVLSGGMQ